MWEVIGAACSYVAAVVDLSIADIFSILCAVGFPTYRYYKSSPTPPKIELLIADLLRGGAFASFGIIIAMAVSGRFMFSHYESQRVELFLAGAIGCFAVIKADKWLVEFFREKA